MKNRTVLVTGGLGFIGSHLVEELSPDNHVLVVDNESSGAVDNIKHLDLENISLNLGDLTTINLNDLLEDVDYVFHLAALASVPHSVADPLLCNRVNVTGTLKLLSAAYKNQVKNFVYSSSAAVYGESRKLPLTEKSSLNPKSPYAASKIAGELYCKVYAEIYGMPTASLRYMNVYGPRQNPKSQYAAAIPKFIEALIHQERPVIYGDGEQTRDFIYVKDVVKANIHFCESEETGEFLIGSGNTITINKLLSILNELLQINCEPAYEDIRSGDIRYSSADIAKSLKAGYEPETDIFTGLQATINSMNK
jgi:UDP-glucose 4-epimerase